ncbi:MAG: hypothetical protein CPSOU_3118 [uncultured Paraburkholderia sp.]|nr:MAG: hypothetical protein CPSOU_3118 [uncultured Paraburkholderia sp.]
MKALAGTAVRVPDLLLFEEDPNVVGGPFFTMVKVEGDITSDYPPGYHGAGFLFDSSPADRAQVWWRSLEIMAKLHAVDWRQPAFDFIEKPADARDALQRRLNLFRRLADWSSSRPLKLVEKALVWLETNMPEVSRMSLCWGDACPSNIIFRDHEPVVALDWELLHLAVPEGDLAYFILVDEVAYHAHG